MAKAASAISHVFGGGDVTFDYHGGSTSSTGVGGVTVNGLIDTGLQRDKTVTISYASSDTTNVFSAGVCHVASEACLAAPDGNITVTLSGPHDVGTDILNRLAQLKTLISQYGQDPVAKGAYQNEINFLEKKLAALGLGSFVAGVFTPGTYAGPSPKQAALTAAASDQTDIGTVNGALGSTTSTIVPSPTTGFGAAASSDYTDTTFGLSANATTALASIVSMTKYDATAQKTTHDDIGTKLTAGQTAVAAINTALTNNVAKQTDINNQTQTLLQAQSDLATALSVLSVISTETEK